MKSFEFYRDLSLKYARSEGLDYQRVSLTTFDLFQKIFSRELNKKERFNAFVKFLHTVSPGGINRGNLYERMFRQLSEFPFNPRTHQFQGRIGHGGESDVYLLESFSPDLPDYVLKIIHGGIDGQTLEERIKQLREEKKEIEKLYSDIPGLIPDEMPLILANPQRFAEKKSIGLVQKFFGHNIRDFFTEVPLEELQEMMRRDPVFADTVLKFCNTTIKHEQETSEIPDMIGARNISVVENKGRFKLLLLDPHGIFSTKPDGKGSQHDNRGRLSHLEGIRGMLLQNQTLLDRN